MPLPDNRDDPEMPENLQAAAAEMARHYTTNDPLVAEPRSWTEKLMAQAASANAARHPAERGLIGQTFYIIFQAITLLLVALLFSILVEWTGMIFFWQDEGTAHSRDMLATELSLTSMRTSNVPS